MGWGLCVCVKKNNAKLQRHSAAGDTRVTVLFHFSLTGLFTAVFALQICFRRKIIKYKHILRALNKTHCAVMLSVSHYELLRPKHFASSFISES